VKKFLAVTLGVIFGGIAISALSLFSPNSLFAMQEEEKNYYQVTINKPLKITGTTTSLVTNNGNAISCQTNGTSYLNKVCKLGYGGYLKNTSKLNKIETICVNYVGDQLLFIASDNEIDIYGTNDSFYDRIYSSYSFNLLRKSYFALKSMGETYISSITLTYYCDKTPTTPTPTIVFDKESMYDPNKEYNITIKNNDHVNLSINGGITKSKANQEISFSYNVDSGYSLYNLEITRESDGLPVNFSNNKFKMEHDNVIIEAKACQYNSTKRAYSEIPSDTHYRNGLSYWNTDNLHPYKEGTLNYNGAAETSGSGQTSGSSAYWTFCQWWCKKSISQSSYYLKDGFHTYADETRSVGINPTTSELHFDINTEATYQSDYGKQLITNGNWPHLLFEQSFTDSSIQFVSDIENEGKTVKLKGDFAVTWNDKKTHQKGMVADCAQFNWYVKLTFKLRPGETKPSDLSEKDFIWVGFPLYDDRYLSGTPTYIAQDKGQPGATNAFIYNFPSYNLIKETFKLNKMYCLDFDIMPNLKTAYNEAVKRGFLTGTKWENMVINYMNFGWEIYSGRVINSSIKNFNLYIS